MSAGAAACGGSLCRHDALLVGVWCVFVLLLVLQLADDAVQRHIEENAETMHNDATARTTAVTKNLQVRGARAGQGKEDCNARGAASASPL